MDWEIVGAVAELLGALGVILSLIYLGGQIRHNTKIAKSTILESAGARSLNLAKFIASEADLTEIVMNGLSGLNELTAQQKNRLTVVFIVAMRSYEVTHAHHQSALLDNDQFLAMKENLRTWLVSPYFEAYWATASKTFNTSFRILVDAMLKETNVYAFPVYESET